MILWGNRVAREVSQRSVPVMLLGEGWAGIFSLVAGYRSWGRRVRIYSTRVGLLLFVKEVGGWELEESLK